MYKHMLMSFGSTNTTTCYKNLLNKVFMEYLDMFVIVFISDILVCTMDEEEHEEHLCLVLWKL
jgi:hypothetical protein